MAKRKFQVKPSSKPKGLPIPKSKKARVNYNASINPFESARASSAKAPKFAVHNRPISGRNNPSNPLKGAGSALKRAIDNRKNGLKAEMERSKKAGGFIDRRIGEAGKDKMTEEERILARIVRERSRRSKKSDKFALEDDEGDNSLTLTHRGKVIGDDYTGKLEPGDMILSDDDDDRYGGQLEKADTELHFGGGAFDREKARLAKNNPYGPSSGVNEDMGDRYRSRKEELDEMIMRKKYEKAEKAKLKEDQIEKFEELDENFKELAALLNFRDKEAVRKEYFKAKKEGTLSAEDKEMDDWDKEMKGYLFERKVKATDRTKTPDEIAKEEADRLHELETRRLARMNGDFDGDDFSDISDDEAKSNKSKKRKAVKKKNKSRIRNPEELDSDDEENDKLTTRFTADGLVYVDKDGNIIKKVGQDDSSSNFQEDLQSESDEEDEQTESSEMKSDDSDIDLGSSDDDASAASSSDEEDFELSTLTVGTAVKAKYLSDQQFDEDDKWFRGTIRSINVDEAGNTRYDIEYDDGDFEEGVKPENIKKQKLSNEEKQKEKEKNALIKEAQLKRRKAKEKARAEIPFVFEVPTTLEALHDIIGQYASTGKDASIIIERIHKANSVRLNHKNSEKMQNFYDVLLRRFVGVGDALFKSGNGGDDLGRYNQLDNLTLVLYKMAQDSPESASAVWGRRIGVFQNALAKRIRDSEFVPIDDDSDDFSVWPSCGTLLLLRAIGHVFPVTDFRHVVVTPTLIYLDQILGQAQVRSLQDIQKGLFCVALAIEYTRDANRFSPEAFSFLASVINLFSDDTMPNVSRCPIPTFSHSNKVAELQNLRGKVNDEKKFKELKLCLEKEDMDSPSSATVILKTALHLVNRAVENCAETMNNGEQEVFHHIIQAVLNLAPKSKTSKLPITISSFIGETASLLQKNLRVGEPKMPLHRRTAAKASELAIQTLAPRMEDPSRYTMAKDKNKTKSQAENDKLRRELKREHKAVTRELRLDAAFIEAERRKAKEQKDAKARDARHRNYAWLEQEQATMNQMVAQGGGLLKGGGIGAAKLKAKSGKIGIKKGGKF